MFGLSKRERLTKAILNACIMQISIYEKTVKIYFNEQNNNADMTDEEAEAKSISCRRAYFDAVFDLICKPFHDSPRLKTLLQLALWTPSATGLPDEYTTDYFADYGISAGSAFAIAYFCLTGKPVKESDYSLLISLNHYQNQLMDTVLAEINKNLCNM